VKKNKNKYSKGDLVYIPQAVNLFTYKGIERYLSTTMRLKVPRNCLVVNADVEQDQVGILYDGETWFVSIGDIYPSTNNEKEI